MNSPVPASGTTEPLFLAERPGDLILEWPHEVGNDRAHCGLNEDLDRHAGDQFDRLKPRDLARRNRDADGVVACTGALILGHVPRYDSNFAVEFRSGTAVERRVAQHRGLTH